MLNKSLKNVWAYGWVDLIFFVLRIENGKAERKKNTKEIATQDTPAQSQ